VSSRRTERFGSGVLLGGLLLAFVATVAACGGPDFTAGAPQVSGEADAGSPDVDNSPIIICNPCPPAPTGDSAVDGVIDGGASDAVVERLLDGAVADAVAERGLDVAIADAGIVDATMQDASGDASVVGAADGGGVEDRDANPSNRSDAPSEANIPVCANIPEGEPCGTGLICHGGACVDCDIGSCPAGCCSTHGCVTVAQSVGECGTGIGGGACTTCAAPVDGTGAATCSTNVCGLSCNASTPDLCGETCVNLQADARHCGACNTACQPAAQCTGGACLCPSGSLSCGGVCAPCTTPPGGIPVCSGTTCSFTCDAANEYTACGNTCALLQTDPNNCGACGHSCLGGGCITGQCQPLIVVDDLAGFVFGVGIDPTNLYFTTGVGGQVGVCPLSGCGTLPTYIKSGIGFAGYLNYLPARSTLLVSDFNNGVIYSLTTAGITNYTISGLIFPAETATDGNFLWWAEQGRIGVASFSNGANVQPYVDTPNEIPFGLWLDNATGDLFATAAGNPGESLECSPSDACTHVSSAAYFNQTVIIVQGSTMYFGAQGTLANNYADGGLFSAPVNNPTNVTALAVGPNYAHPYSITADSKFVYFFSIQSKNIYKCGLNGCGGVPTEIVQAQFEVPSMVNDAQYLYWGGNSQVLKVAK
jgi:hypothetical protein